MYSSETKFNIFVASKPVREYFHEGRYYIEGRRDHEYTISVQNLTSKRKKIIISVDGLNIMTGDSTWEKGYCLNPWQQIDIPGWKKDSNDTAAFTFGSVSESYNEHNKAGNVSNVGVIGCKVFDERPPPVHIVHEYIPVYHYHNPRPPVYPNWNWHGTIGGQGGAGSWGYGSGGTAGGAGGGTTTSCSGGGGALGSAQQYQMSFNAGDAPKAINLAHSIAQDSYYSEVKTSGVVNTSSPPSELGTKWGRNKEFRTTTVHYDFYDTPIDIFTLYYDTKRGLSRRGIDLYDFTYSPREPNPFPTDGCPPPVRK